MIEAKIIADSISEGGKRITTFSLKYPRFIHSEFMTHRMFSRNAASSRAIPVKKVIDQLLKEPAMPYYWGKNQSGMQAKEELDGFAKQLAITTWLEARDSAIRHAQALMDLGVHKQTANRILEPWFTMQTICTATEFDNFYNLRRHPDAQPEIKILADCMFEAQQISMAETLFRGEWHLPYITEEERNTLDINTQQMCCVARCCRVSYMNHDGTKPDISKDIELYYKLLSSGHMSPFEHMATPLKDRTQKSGNFVGWQQYRKEIIGEEVFKGIINKT